MDEHDLSTIPGLGPARRAALIAAGIHDLKSLLELKVAELAAIRGIGAWQARRIHEHLRQRGLLIDAETPSGEPVVLVRPSTPDEVEEVQQIVQTLEQQAAMEAELAREVRELQSAVAEAEAAPQTRIKPSRRRSAEADEPAEERSIGDEAPPEPPAELLAEPPADSADSEEEGPEAEPAPEALELRRRREQLPETALALMEAIRAASVAPQLTRQLTRLLIITGEIVDAGGGAETAAQEAAATALAEVDGLLHQALEREAFSPRAQRVLATRVRRCRKGVQRHLGESASTG